MKNIEKLPKESNRDYAFRVIRENIIKLVLKPGTMLSEQDLADELELSRTPVHEALQELSKSKIVEVFPQKGSLVSLINLELVEEAVFVRATLESAITQQAAKAATEEDIKYLKENLELQEFLLKQNNVDKFMEMDNAFHEKMYAITNKMQCYYMVKAMNIHHDRFRELRVQGADRAPIIAHHKQILQAICDHDGDAAQKYTYEHITRTRIDAEEIRRKYPDYFA
ncbi:MAG: GntR family transcriptional regulator [Treponema sp.]|nr:GntR family transcriptional regulator [Treponema sp.]